MKRPDLKKAMKEVEKMEESSLGNLASAKKKAIETIKSSKDFIVFYIEEDGGGSVGAVRQHRRIPMAMIVADFIKKMMRKEMEDD